MESASSDNSKFPLNKVADFVSEGIGGSTGVVKSPSKKHNPRTPFSKGELKRDV
jgi:hypothetical protein